MGENVGEAKQVDEDSFVYQFKQVGKSVGFMGDCFWIGLFGSQFDHSWNSNKFSVSDLDTNDLGIQDRMEEYLQLHDVNIFHFTGADHASHSYELSHPEFDRKIRELDNALYDLEGMLEDGTTMLVFSDHGALDSGNHGGASEQERATILFSYSKGHAYDTIFDVT